MKKFKKKNLYLAAAALTLTATVSVGSAMAYFTTYATAGGSAKISLGSTSINPGEEVINMTKHIVVENTGDYDCYVRVKLLAGEKYQEGLEFKQGEHWYQGADGYFYYDLVVPAKGKTEELQVKINDMGSQEDFNVVVVQECTPVIYGEDGEAKGPNWDRVIKEEEVDES